MTEHDPIDSPARIVVVTGVSGAGKSTALKAFEDLGYEAIDNVPISLMNRLIGPGGDQISLAIGADIRTRGFDAEAFLAMIQQLSSRPELDVRLLFVDSTDDILVRRFEETRRRHPLAADRPLSDGIREERALIAPLKDSAEIVIDTSDMTSGDMKPLLEAHFTTGPDAGMTVFLTSFGFKNGLPRGADLVFDVRFLRNPHYIEGLRPQSGCDQAVGDYVADDEGFAPFMDGLKRLLQPLLPRYAAEGKSYLTIAIGCTGGRHRSVFVAEQLAAWIDNEVQRYLVRHRDLEKAVK